MELPKKQIYEIYYIYIYVFLFVYYFLFTYLYFCLFLHLSYIDNIYIHVYFLYISIWSLFVFYLGGWALQTKSFSNQNKGHVDSTPNTLQVRFIDIVCGWWGYSLFIQFD